MQEPVSECMKLLCVVGRARQQEQDYDSDALDDGILFDVLQPPEGASATKPRFACSHQAAQIACNRADADDVLETSLKTVEIVEDTGCGRSTLSFCMGCLLMLLNQCQMCNACLHVDCAGMIQAGAGPSMIFPGRPSG